MKRERERRETRDTRRERVKQIKSFCRSIPSWNGKDHVMSLCCFFFAFLQLQLLKDRTSRYTEYSMGGNYLLSDEPNLNSKVNRSLVRRHNHHLDVHGQLQHNYPHTAHSSGRPGPPDLFLHHPSWEEYTSCGPRYCSKIYCTIEDLAKGESVLFSIRSRLWRETVVDIASPEFAISSKMVTLVTHLPYDVDPGYLPPEVAVVTTHVHVTGLETPGPIPLWIILLAVVGGLLVLSLLTLCFYQVRMRIQMKRR